MRLYHQGTTYSKLFSDGVYGSPKKALKAARKYRKQLAKKLGIESLEHRRRTRRLSSKRIETGVVGVYRGVSKTKSGKERHYYAVSWNPKPNVVRTKSFSIAKYGEEEAFRLAVRYREKMLKKVLGYLPDELPAPDEEKPRYCAADAVMQSSDQDAEPDAASRTKKRSSKDKQKKKQSEKKKKQKKS